MTTCLKASERNADSQSRDKKGNQQGDAKVVGLLRGANGLELSFSKSFQSELGEIAGLARITSWGFTGANQAVISNLHAFDFRGMQTSRVVSTGSWSSPSSEDASAQLQPHRVLSLNTFDHIPADRMSGERIHNGETFVVEDDAWTNEEQVSAPHDGRTPQSGINLAAQTSTTHGYSDDSTNNESSHSDGGVYASRAIELAVVEAGHEYIFSQLIGLEWSKS